MKFILVNLAIVGVLAYLLVVHDSIPGGSRNAVSDAVLKATSLADRAVERIAGPDKPAMPAKTPAVVEPPASPATVKPETPKTETAKTPMPKAEPPKIEAPKADTAKTETPRAETTAATPSPTPVVPPAVDVAPRPAPAMADEAAAVARLGAAAEKRRSDVLAETPAKRPGPAQPKTRFAVKEGGTLMTPRERRRELDVLIDSMELVYLRHHGE